MARARSSGIQSYDRIIAAVAAVVGLGLVAFVIVRNEAFADPNFAVMMRVILSLVAAVFGATLPGFLNITWQGSGFALRAGGALALFALTYIFTPTVIQPALGDQKVACVDVITDDPTAFATTTRCNLSGQQVGVEVLSNLQKAALQLQLMQFSQSGGLFTYLRNFIADPSQMHWTTVNTQAKRVHDYIDAALTTVGKYEAFTTVTLATDKPAISEMLYGKLPLIDELTDPAPPSPEHAQELLGRLTEINSQVQVELDKLMDEIRQRTTT